MKKIKKEGINWGKDYKWKSDQAVLTYSQSARAGRADKSLREQVLSE